MTMPLIPEEQIAINLVKEQVLAAIEERAKAFEELAANERLLPQFTDAYLQAKTTLFAAKCNLTDHKKRHAELLRQVKIAKPRKIKPKKVKKDKKPKAAKAASQSVTAQE